MKKLMVLFLISSLFLLCSCGLTMQSLKENDAEYIRFPHNNNDVNVMGIVGDAVLYSISNSSFEIKELVTDCYLYSLSTSQTRKIGSIKSAVASSGDVIITGNKEVYLALRIEDENPKTVLYCVDVKKHTLKEKAIMDTNRPLIFFEKVDDASFLMFDCGKEVGENYHSYVYQYNIIDGSSLVLQDNSIDMNTNIGTLLCSVSYDSGHIYCLKQVTTLDKTSFVIEKLNIDGTLTHSYDLGFLFEFLKDPDEPDMFKSILDFVVAGNNVIISDYSGSSIIFNLDAEIIYNGDRFTVFETDTPKEYFLSSFTGTKKYLFSASGLNEISNPAANDAIALWSGDTGHTVVAMREIDSNEEISIIYKKISGELS